jgi:hypothetical protein
VFRATASQRPPSIITAVDAHLFEPFFQGEPWNRWRTVLKAAYGRPLSEQELAFFQSIAGGRDPPGSRVRELWCVAGRGGGAGG